MLLYRAMTTTMTAQQVSAFNVLTAAGPWCRFYQYQMSTVLRRQFTRTKTLEVQATLAAALFVDSLFVFDVITCNDDVIVGIC
jgi:hypothetical protein